MKEGYIKKEDRKKILFLCDDIRFNSGIATMAREIVINTSHRFNWVNLGAAINHPEVGKRMDVSEDTNRLTGITDASVTLYPSNGYGDAMLIRQLIEIEKPDAIMIFTDPRYWIWLFQIENEIRKKMPICYLNIWDDFPAPIYNRSFYESCDALFCISKQTKLINELVLGDKTKDKVIKYVPHGIDEKTFFPITEFMSKESEELEDMRKKVFKGDNPEFVVFYNARNIRRKCTPDLVAAYSIFCDKIGKEKASKCALLMHTSPVDENGTDLNAVVELLCDPEYQKVYFTEDRFAPNQMNLLYNLTDVTCLLSSNEGWGLSITEAMMSGKMIIANVTGGMQDQMRFVDDEGKWFEPTKDCPSNHFGKYKDCADWAIPLFPTNVSIVGSIPTPYIYDDRCDFRDAAEAILKVYEMSDEERNRRGMLAREWVTSEESSMSSQSMCKNIINGIEDTLKNWKPRKNFELIKSQPLPRKAILHPIVY
jgi:glycosyltransferase involved in cell wall biosynthesis